MLLKNVNRAELSRDFIFSKLSPLEIYQRYIPNYRYNKLLPSPFRTEESPSFIINNFKGDLLFHDFGTNTVGDCIKLVMMLNNCNYSEALSIIYSDFNLNKVTNTIIKTTNLESKPDKIKTIIKPNISIMMNAPYLYWEQYGGISRELLRLFEIRYSNSVLVVKEKEYNLYGSESNPMFVYFCYDEKKEFIGYKIYRPFSAKDDKWISNTNAKVVFGIKQLAESGDILIITKALKDVVCLHNIGYNAIAFNNEHILPSTDFLESLRIRFKNIYCFLDYDDTGIRDSDKYFELGIQPIFTMEKQHKDPSDYIKEYGNHKLIELINSQI